jgi:hypothetical protein
MPESMHNGDPGLLCDPIDDLRAEEACINPGPGRFEKSCGEDIALGNSGTGDHLPDRL